MTLEVELKAQCPGARGKVESLGASYVSSEKQTDTYFHHPKRDFKKTDEALRIREADGSLKLTYKGPKQKSDLKTREEIEFPVSADASALLQRLGFTPAFQIKKKRHTYKLNGLTLCCDDVEGLGEYLEVESNSPSDHDKITDLSRRLGLSDKTTTKSYSQLLGL